jgi:hypothetical protein
MYWPNKASEAGMVFNEDFLGRVADQVKLAFLDKGVPPTEEVTKIANEHDLSIEQVKRVCEESNKLIKMATKAKDPQFVFPVADATMVLEGINMKMALLKEAASSLPQREEMYGYGGKGTSEMNKLASTLEPSTARMNGSNKAVYLGAKRGENKLIEKLVEENHAIEKSAGLMIEMLYEEGRKNRTLNQSYSNLMKCATTPASRDHIHNFYMYANEFLNKIAGYRILLDDVELLDKTASVINPADPLIREMNNYMTLRAKRDKTAALRNIMREKLRLFAQRAVEED